MIMSFEAFFVLYVLIFTLNEHTLNLKDSIEYVQRQIALFLKIQSTSLLRWFLYYSLYHSLIAYIKRYNELFYSLNG